MYASSFIPHVHLTLVLTISHCHHVHLELTVIMYCLPVCIHSLSLTVASISGHFSPETGRWLVVNVNDPLTGLVLNIANWQAAMIVGGYIGEEMYFCLIYSWYPSLTQT